MNQAQAHTQWLQDSLERICEHHPELTIRMSLIEGPPTLVQAQVSVMHHGDDGEANYHRTIEAFAEVAGDVHSAQVAAVRLALGLGGLAEIPVPLPLPTTAPQAAVQESVRQSPPPVQAPNPPAAPPAPAPPPAGVVKQPLSDFPPTSEEGNTRPCSAAQMGLITRLAKERGWPDADTFAEALMRLAFFLNYDALTMGQASWIIERLKSGALDAS